MRKFQANALERAVNYVRQARANAIAKDKQPHNAITKDCGVSGTYSAQLRKAGHITKTGWEQKGLKDFDIAINLLNERKGIKPKETPKQAKPEVKTVPKQTPAKKPSVGRPKKTEQKSVEFRIFGLKVFEKKYL